MDQKPPSPNTCLVVEDDVPEPDNSLLVCAEGDASLGVTDSVTGRCSECSTTIHWAISASPRIKKICGGCAFKRPCDGFMLTETTMQEVLKVLCIEDTPENRAILLSQTAKMFNNEIEKRKEKKDVNK